MTGQGLIASEHDVGLTVAVALINDLDLAGPEDPMATLRHVLSVDPPSLERLSSGDVPALVDLAHELHEICRRLGDGDLDDAAELVNDLLARHSAHPHLAFDDGRWQLHHHPKGAAVVPMWTAITADALARLIGDDQHDRVGRCAAGDCGRVFVDGSKNRSRRFCSTTCQNRVKAAAFRQRQRVG
ncbi:MAG: CGNR zinc finger domain-containing protein [Actinomycetota bacterium]